MFTMITLDCFYFIYFLVSKRLEIAGMGALHDNKGMERAVFIEYYIFGMKHE